MRRCAWVLAQGHGLEGCCLCGRCQAWMASWARQEWLGHREKHRRRRGSPDQTSRHVVELGDEWVWRGSLTGHVGTNAGFFAESKARS
eukprot:1159522-Pelagomonas_calceolata.AAC.1